MNSIHNQDFQKSSLLFHALAGSLLFHGLSRNEQILLLKKGHKKNYSAGETIFNRGEKGGWILLIEAGIAEVSIMSMSGRRSVLNHMQQGEIIGEISLFDQASRSADVIAKKDVSGLILPRETVIEFLKKNSDACFAIIQTLCSRVRNASEMFETRSLTAASARLARCLLRFGEKWGLEDESNGLIIQQNISQSDLGEFAGIARENVNRYMQTWSRENILQFDKGNITLLDIDRLQDLAEL